MRLKKVVLNPVLIFVVVFSVISSKCTDNKNFNAKTKADKKVRNFLGEEFISFFDNASEVKIHLLDPFGEKSKTEFFGYSELGVSDILVYEDLMFLNNILKSDSSYSFDNTIKNCTFLPSHAISFYNNQLDDTLSILMDFNCKVWQFNYKGVTKFEDFDNVSKPLKDWLDLKSSSIKRGINNNGLMYKKIENELSLSASQNIKKAEKIEAFLIDPQKAVSDGNIKFNNFLVIDSLKLTNSYKNILLKIIQNHEVSDNNYIKNCTFLPDVGFRFVDEKENFTDMMVAFYCDDLMITRDGKSFVVDSKAIRSDLLELSMSIFPNDTYLKKITSQDQN